MKRKGSKVGSELERLVEAWLQLDGWLVHRAAASGFNKTATGRGFVRSHDLLGCFDFLAVRTAMAGTVEAGRPQIWFLQATSPATRSTRREKILAKGPWPFTCRVSILHHVSSRVSKETLHYFMVEDLEPQVSGGGAVVAWGEPARIEVDVKALEAHRSSVHAAKKAARLASERLD